jgi:hypothetical protein
MALSGSTANQMIATVLQMILAASHPKMVAICNFDGSGFTSIPRLYSGEQGKLGNPTDSLPSRPTVKSQSSSVGLPRHPWE